MNYKHLFGPVLSRRLGHSLGVDVVPYKYCPLNCVYCEVQRTTQLTLQREEFFPLEEIISELDEFLKEQPPLDYITFSGAGEPTLYSRIGELIAYIKDRYPQYKLALLTNGMLLDRDDLRRDILPCDLILPSLDACSEPVFERINRPHPELSVTKLIESLVTLRKEYKGQIWLEVFIIAGVNDTQEELDCLCRAITGIKPDRVQINSLDRPAAEEWVQTADSKTLDRVSKYFKKHLQMPVEIIAKVHLEDLGLELPQELVSNLEALLSRRPCTAEELSHSLGMHINEISKTLRQLNMDNKLDISREERGVFYAWKR
ncbi:MAG: radical SAM protein [Candidatus Cloacimonetes bacterium]|nr:radical SAM protein [Candidatus Cloacimonadota bacterium]